MIEFSGTSLRALKKLDRQVARQITAYLRDVVSLDDPRAGGKGLTGNLAGLWQYRVGNYRVICEIHDEIVTIYVIDVQRRSSVCRG
ncbi:type II toxin-antitoxin system RelE family toxin [Kocuria salsicia]|uniref:type II toxin-antitoxin system RelE family toxin n=1 Tax=Kocuria salsicia TaxID=664639 RepID=UPI0021B6685D|nr:type II toxin-antitoxin system RelE/ParE family toxin [Kocuria salsicia]